MSKLLARAKAKKFSADNSFPHSNILMAFSTEVV